VRHNPASGPGGRVVKRKRFSVEQITAILQQAESGVAVGDVCRQVGISEQTFYRWKKEYGGMLPSEAWSGRGGQHRAWGFARAEGRPEKWPMNPMGHGAGG
jgi:transposase-like protein